MDIVIFFFVFTAQQKPFMFVQFDLSISFNSKQKKGKSGVGVGRDKDRERGNVTLTHKEDGNCRAACSLWTSLTGCFCMYHLIFNNRLRVEKKKEKTLLIFILLN